MPVSKKTMAFAGSWYPATADECRPFIEGCSDKKRPDGDFVGGIVPHAGWYYSGSIACRVIGSLTSDDPIDTVVLFGGHMHPQSDPFVLGSGSLETPFGDILVDEQLCESISRDVNVIKKTPQAFPDENTFELQNPFIKYFFPDSRIVVCAVAPNSSAVDIGRCLAQNAEALGRTIRVIGSTDMTHYGPNFGLITAGTGKDAVKWVEKHNDRGAIDAMVEMDESKIIKRGLENKSMCCPGAAAATASACKTIGAVRAIELDYATSFEKSASESFVGYSGVLYARG